MEQKYVTKLNIEIYILFKNALSLSLTNPGQLLFFIKTLFSQLKAAGCRAKNEKQGLHVPPFMIFSVTNQCNLNCHGCYSKQHHKQNDAELSAEKIRAILTEASRLGISIALLAGGEPLLKEGLLETTAQFPEIIFALFTNGLKINNETIKEFRKQKNLIPIISLEGEEPFTDSRRGTGAYEKLQGTLKKLKKHKVFFGISLTVTSENFTHIFDGDFIKETITAGSRLFFFIEYIPVKENTQRLIVSEIQKKQIGQYVETFRKKYPALFIAFPSGEEDYGGCLAAGRGFIHISPAGKLEPCPFSPYSDTDLNRVSLKEALKSKLLKTIRDNHQNLKETKGGCALWENRQWVESLTK
ncbi:MAG: hypothetical protein A2252_08970 [Elusimicrobia bacterium RIFOXYA2_FULL_39_19]|nr:MAG: hypothetical protein A2252_08970 [Elusimicrobia bacterium RIFOXYA2_FULL_39_19]